MIEEIVLVVWKSDVARAVNAVDMLMFTCRVKNETVRLRKQVCKVAPMVKRFLTKVCSMPVVRLR
ncbi:hypothetical protein KEJ33_04130 [Candidatus Bathyarchaeota archaeon]|nr:hypothetical protein [Candidatus Bathyarchaeota archaeon]